MDIADILSLEAVEDSCRATSKKALLRHMAKRAQKMFGLDATKLFQALMDREKLGSTGIGEGIAIPHACLEGVSHISGIFARIKPGVEFDAVDDRPVDLALLLVIPEKAGAEYLKLLAWIARRFRDPKIRDKLRGAVDSAALYAVLTTEAVKESEQTPKAS